MGHKLSSLCISGDDDDNNDDSFQEVQRRKTRDGGGDRARRKSSGLSRYSNDFQHTIEEPLKIAAFNVRRFGAAKMKQNVVVDILVKIIKQFDIIIVQEVVDSSEKAVHDLLEAVNSSDDKYQMVLSPRLGRNTQKEQYLIIFRLMYFSSRDSDLTTNVVRLYVCMSICPSVHPYVHDALSSTSIIRIKKRQISFVTNSVEHSNALSISQVFKYFSSVFQVFLKHF